MIERKLKNYTWRYENGVATLIDKRDNSSFKLPIFYVNSFIRAGLAFINVYRKEQIVTKQRRINVLKTNKASVRLKSFDRQKKLQDTILKCRMIISNYKKVKQQKLI